MRMIKMIGDSVARRIFVYAKFTCCPDLKSSSLLLNLTQLHPSLELHKVSQVI